MPAYADPSAQLSHVRDLLAALPADRLGDAAPAVREAVEAIDHYKSMDDATLAVLTSPTISVNQYAALMGVDRTTAYAAVKNGEVDAIRVGSKRIRIPSAPLLRLLGLDEDT